ncbi:proliferating cell nuclear antigen [Dionaea muscipula]
MSFRFKVQQAWVLKRVLGAIACMGTTALMEILPSGILVRVTSLIHDVLALLRISATGFHYYSCDKSCFIHVNVHEFTTIINSAMDDEAISIFGDDPPNVVYFVFINQNCDESRNASMTASEASREHWPTDDDDSSHEFRVCIRSEDFAQILEQSKLNNEAIHISMMSTMVMLVSGSDIIILRKENQECLIENVPASTRHDLWVSLNHLDSFLLASLVTSTVWIHDSHSRSQVPPILEFPLGELGKLLFYLPQPFTVS